MDNLSHAAAAEHNGENENPQQVQNSKVTRPPTRESRRIAVLTEKLNADRKNSRGLSIAIGLLGAVATFSLTLSVVALRRSK